MSAEADANDVAKTNISVSLPKETAADLRSRAGRRGVSAYVTAAVEHQLAMDRLGEIVSRYEEGHDPLTEAEIAAASGELFEDPTTQRTA